MPEDEFAAVHGHPTTRWKRLVWVSWAAVVVGVTVLAVLDPSPINVVLAAGFVTLSVLTWLQQRQAGKLRRRNLHQLQLRLDNATYLNEFQTLPNRNYLLDQLRREMPRARANGEPFTLVIVSIEDLPGIARRRGVDYAERAGQSLGRLIERFTRASDFAAGLANGTYCILLYDCTGEMAQSYLRRVPGVIAVSNGRRTLEVPLLVQLSEYDLESIYAIDVLRDAEAAPLARKPEDLRVGAEAA